MNNNLSFLIIDDEKYITVSLKTLIAKTFPKSEILMAFDGREGWDKIKEHHPSVVISDLAMPVMNGMQLLKRVRENTDFSDIYFIVLTANIETAERLKALDEGADDYIIKPFSADELIARLRSATRFVQLQLKMKEENTLLNKLTAVLENEIHNLTLLAINFLQARIPSSVEILKKVSKTSVWIANQLGGFEQEQIQDIEIAAFLCYAGKIFLPDNLLKTPVMMNGMVSDNLMYQVPTSSREIVSSVERFKPVGDILYHLYENFDGSGFPERMKSWQIPIGSRIIRVALDYEEIIFYSGKNSNDTIQLLYREANRLYDHRIITLLDQYLVISSGIDSNLKERAVQLQELEEGMVLSRDIITNSGLKLMSAGGILKQNVINKILAMNTSDPILGHIFIKI